MPGLGLVEATDFSVRLSVRAANCLGRAECITLSTLAALTPEKILDLPSVGTNVAEEIFSVAASEWAASYLTATERALRDRSAGVASDDRGSINVAARDLADALAEVEAIGGFIAFRRRRLDIDNPTQSKVAMELGVSGSRVSRLERAVHSKLSRKLRDNDWAITKAVSSLRERLGSLALLNDLDDILAAIDPAGAVLSDDLPHRRVLLLDLAGYQVSGQWVLGPEIESLTQAILSDLTKEGQVDIESARQSLVRLGIKEVIQLPWIINQPDFRVVDGKLLRVSVE